MRPFIRRIGAKFMNTLFPAAAGPAVPLLAASALSCTTDVGIVETPGDRPVRAFG
jgi:hypothetical protein